MNPVNSGTQSSNRTDLADLQDDVVHSADLHAERRPTGQRAWDTRTSATADNASQRPSTPVRVVPASLIASVTRIVNCEASAVPLTFRHWVGVGLGKWAQK